MKASKHGLSNDERVKIDYDLMRPWLPEKCTSILDIGCGFARIDVLLARHYNCKVEVNLLDGEQFIPNVGKEQVGFNPVTVPWKDRNAGVKTLKKAVPDVVVHGHDPDPSLTIPADLVVSLRAWGHHFPIETYLDLLDRSLRPNGRLIVDIRNETNGIDVLAARGFRVISDSLEYRSQKCKRFALERSLDAYLQSRPSARRRRNAA